MLGNTIANTIAKHTATCFGPSCDRMVDRMAEARLNRMRESEKTVSLGDVMKTFKSAYTKALAEAKVRAEAAEGKSSYQEAPTVAVDTNYRTAVYCKTGSFKCW